MLINIAMMIRLVIYEQIFTMQFLFLSENDSFSDVFLVHVDVRYQIYQLYSVIFTTFKKVYHQHFT